MQGTIPKQLIDHFKRMLIEGEIYHISGFVVVPAQSSYRVSNHPFRIQLLKNTFIKAFDDKNVSIPFERFEFLNFDDAKARMGDKTFLSGTLFVKLHTYVYIFI